MARQDLIDQFEQQGIMVVRERIQEWSGTVKSEAIGWLAQKEADERLRNERSQAEQTRLARSANRAAWIAAIAAIIAAIAAIVTIVLELKK